MALITKIVSTTTLRKCSIDELLGMQRVMRGIFNYHDACDNWYSQKVLTFELPKLYEVVDMILAEKINECATELAKDYEDGMAFDE